MTTTKTKPSPSPDPDTIFAELLQDLPPETAELARQFNAFARARKIKTPEQLLRAVLLFAALDYTEREIAANLVLTSPDIGKLSNQAVRERLAACLPWLQALLPQLIERPALPGLPSGLRLLALDASEISAPGGKGAWRLHALMEVVSLQLVAVELTDLKTGETLCNFEFAPGDVVLTDRGYSHRRGVSHLLKSEGEIARATTRITSRSPMRKSRNWMWPSGWPIANAERGGAWKAFSPRRMARAIKSGCMLAACRSQRPPPLVAVACERARRENIRRASRRCFWLNS